MHASTTLAYWASRRLRRLGRAVVDGVLPPRCLACGDTVGAPDTLCGKCWRGITFFAPPWCSVCGAPFAHPMGENAVCGECAREARNWDRARAVLRYDKSSRHLVLGLKYGDRTLRRSGNGCTAAAARFSTKPICSCRFRCTGRGCFG